MRPMDKGFVLWFTGLSGSGKTTVARRVAEILRGKGFKVELLDGDEVRKWLSPEAGFTREDRTRHLIRVANVARLLARNGVIVLCSFVSPYIEVRKKIREIIEKEGIRFFEIYVKCSLEECIRRDPKGLYKRALRGEIKNMTGIDDPYEPPPNPEIVINTENNPIEELVEHVLQKINEYIKK
ncbi:MAG: adenylyl-sulfate kinase [Thermoprotei archaeon]|nr:MAG: adenylyl-sulfate kinase [Thermoprotei archaeon]